MDSDEQKNKNTQGAIQGAFTTTPSTESDEMSVRLAAIEGEAPSGDAQTATVIEDPDTITHVASDATEANTTEESGEVESAFSQEKSGAANVAMAAGSVQKPSKIAGLFTSRKQVVIASVVAGALALAGGVGTFAMLYKAPVLEAQTVDTNKSKQTAKMGVAIVIADGTVTYQKVSGGEWSPVKIDTQLAEGSQIKTAAESRAVLQFDDGSALRLDASSIIGLTNLAVNDVKIAQVDGTSYSRVVPSQRNYTVTVDGVDYKALGTAFSTTRSTTEKGVRVFQSHVQVGSTDTVVDEGKQYLNDAPNAELKNKVSDIDYDSLADNGFVKWNLAEDEKVASFKDKLGALNKVRERIEQKAKEQIDTTAKTKAESEAKLKTEKDKAVKKDGKSEVKDKIYRGAMSLSRNGEMFTWNYTGRAIYGYKLVYSKSNNIPVFGTDEALYFGSINETSGGLPDVSKTGGVGTYYVRVCAYTAGSENDPCVDYSNVITIVRN